MAPLFVGGLGLHAGGRMLGLNLGAWNSPDAPQLLKEKLGVDVNQPLPVLGGLKPLTQLPLVSAPVWMRGMVSTYMLMTDIFNSALSDDRELNQYAINEFFNSLPIPIFAKPAMAETARMLGIEADPAFRSPAEKFIGGFTSLRDESLFREIMRSQGIPLLPED
jgi:hypothetical protein